MALAVATTAIAPSPANGSVIAPHAVVDSAFGTPSTSSVDVLVNAAADVIANVDFAPLVAALVLYTALSAALLPIAANAGRPQEYGARLVSIVHSSIAVVLTGAVVVDAMARVLMPEQSSMIADLDVLARIAAELGAPTSALQAAALLHSVGYFIVDFISMVATGALEPTFAFHHVGAILGLLWPAAIARTCSCLFAVILLVLEASNPLQHVRWLAVYEAFGPSQPSEASPEKKAALSQPVPATTARSGTALAVSEFTGHAFIVTFTLARAVLGPALIVTSAQIPEVPWPLTALGCAFFAGSMAELFRIVTLQYVQRDPRWTC